MKTPAEILAKNANGLQQPSWILKTPTGNAHPSSEGYSIGVETKAMVNMIFARFMAIYGHKFKSCFETEDEIRIAKREWALSLVGLSESQLVAAVDRCKDTLAWMPSIAEFLAIIAAQDEGFPSVHDAYVEACRYAAHPLTGAWSHPIVYHAGKATEWFRLRSQEEREVFPVFRYHYDVVKQRFLNGEVLDDPIAPAIEDKHDVTLCHVIQAFSEAHDVAPNVAASLFYYLTKPQGSRTRARYRDRAMQHTKELHLSVLLPE